MLLLDIIRQDRRNQNLLKFKAAIIKLFFQQDNSLARALISAAQLVLCLHSHFHLKVNLFSIWAASVISEPKNWLLTTETKISYFLKNNLNSGCDTIKNWRPKSRVLIRKTLRDYLRDSCVLVNKWYLINIFLNMTKVLNLKSKHLLPCNPNRHIILMQPSTSHLIFRLQTMNGRRGSIGLRWFGRAKYWGLS